MSNSKDDIYALYVKAYRTYNLTWLGPEPVAAEGQLAIVFGKEDGKLPRNPIKTREELMKKIAEYNERQDFVPVGLGWGVELRKDSIPVDSEGVELRIQSDMCVKLSYSGMTFNCQPRSHLGSILKSNNKTDGEWYWYCHRTSRSSRSFNHIESALADFCHHAFDEPIKL